MMLHYVQGDLLKSKAEALVNTVNCVGVMGKGIALSFKKKFPENFKAYKLACDEQQMRPGKMFVYPMDDLFEKKIIINFPTKKHWREKTKLSYIIDGLQDLVAVIDKYHIQSLALPPLGCGNGGLDWYDVKPLIEKYLESVSCNVYIYEPYVMNSCHLYNHMTKKQAALLCAMDVYRKPELDNLSRLEIQKLAYFLQVLGVPLNLKFDKGACGPFSEQLKNVLRNFEYNNYIKDIKHNKSPETEEIVLIDFKLNEAYRIVEADENLINTINKLQKLIFRFETAYGLELLSTVHWVAQEFPDFLGNIEFIIEKVKNWNERKQVMFKEYQIKVTYQKLRENQLI